MSKLNSPAMAIVAVFGLLLLTSSVLDAATDTTIKGTTSDNTQQSLEVTNSSNTSLMVVRNDGNVGIGDASPAALLTVGSGDLFQVDSSGNASGPNITANTNFVPDANDGAGLGTTSLQFSDLFLASGAVINFNNGSYTLTGGTNTLTTGGSGANGNELILAAGGTSLPPLLFTAGTNMTTPSDGAIEMDADAIYGTTDAGNRGVIPVEHIIRADGTRTFTSNTSQQAIFTTPTNGTLTLETGTYIFEGLIAMDTMSTTSGNGKFSLIGAGTATLGAILWTAMGQDALAEATAGATGGGWHIIATQTAANVSTAAGAAGLCFYVKGTFEVTGAGTIIPSFAQTTSAAAVVNIGSYFKVNRIGSTSMTSVGQWT